jgi:phosphoserine phosphatase RsbU/P
MPYLEALNGPNTGHQYTIEDGESILGRHPDCTFVLESGAVSRQHAKITKRLDDCFISDLKSRNGTFVNGQLISGEKLLRDGEAVRICDLEFTFHDDRESVLDMTGQTLLSKDASSVGVLVMNNDVSDSASASKFVTERMEVKSSASGVELSATADRKLTVMIEIVQKLSRSIRLEEVLPNVLEGLFQIFIQADRGFIVLKNEKGDLVPRWMKSRRPDQEDTLRLSRTIMKHVMEEKQAVISLDAANDDRFNQSQSVFDLKLRSVIIAPLLNSDDVPIGAIHMDTVQQRGKFERKDLELLAAVAGQAAIAIENAQLHEQIVNQAMLDQDLRLAREVQLAFLPKEPPKVAGFEFYKYYTAANMIGGDYFDFIPIDAHRWAIVVADVVGHGVAAAMFMAKLAAETRFAFSSIPEPALAMKQLNDRMCELNAERFVTMILVIIDSRTNKLVILNAGHMAPMLKTQSGETKEIGGDDGGFPLAIIPDADYTATESTLANDDTFLLYTDGIFEAPNAEGKQFSIQRIEGLLKEGNASCEQTGQKIITSVREHIGTCPQEDDMCLVIVRKVAT